MTVQVETSAQIRTWLAVHRGSIDRVADVDDASPADAALARMMLHRRRAAAAEVIGEFFSGVGTRFRPYLQGCEPQAPRSGKEECAAAADAGKTVADLCGAPPPLLFERALLADAEGRGADALADLDALLDSFPGFLVAAVTAARLALASGDPGRAIQWLAYVESELAATREGSALLADALRAVGLSASASTYDLAALVGSGYGDSRGNDCAPVDLNGSVALDPRMPPPLVTAKNRSEGRLLCNDRGVYYVARSKLGISIFEVTGSLRLISAPRRPARGAANGDARFGGGQTGGLRIAGSAIPVAASNAAGRRLRRILAMLGRLPWRVVRRVLLFLYVRHRELASRTLVVLNRYVPSTLRYWEFSFIEIAERDRRSPLARVRLQSGLARIFRTAPESLYAGAGEAFQSAQLPAPAAAVLRQLTGESQLIGEPTAAGHT